MAVEKRVLVVEDDEMLRSSLIEQFTAHGYEPVPASSFAEGCARATDGSYEFIILDISLPDGDGRNLCQLLRDKDVICPIIMLTAADSEKDIIAGLNVGANDYVVKPFRFAVLMACIDTHLRSHEVREEAVYRIGPYAFRPSARLLIEGNNRIRLTEKETNILKFLRRSSDAVSREVLLHEVWGYNPAVTTHTLETHIYRLRKKIEKDPAKAEILITKDGGYRLVG